MPADRLLNTVLRAYQEAPNPSDPAETDRILATTTTLLASLGNPLNLALLTSHFLTARAIWQAPPGGLRTCLRVLGVYNTAAIRVRRNELDNTAAAAAAAAGRTFWSGQRQQPPPPAVGSGVRAEAWARAVAKGLDDRSPRWQHALVLAGVLVGMESGERASLSRGLRATLEQAVVTAANLALEDPARTGPLGRGAVVLALTYAFPLLSDPAKQLLNGNVLPPAVIEAALGEEGFQHGAFIDAIANDVVPSRGIVWTGASPSVARLQHVESRPLVQNMGSVSRLAAFAIQTATDTNVVLHVQEELQVFTAQLLEKWGRCALSTVDMAVEAATLSPEVLQRPWPMLWRLLRKVMYTVVAILQPIVGRSLLDSRLRNHLTAPTVAMKTLHTLRNLSFISSRGGASSFQVYTFTYMAALDILTRYPEACTAFLRETLPPPLTGGINTPPPPVVQALTLFYLNTAEHLPLSLTTDAADALILAPATAHLAPSSSSWLTSASAAPGGRSPASAAPAPTLELELFEAAHSAVLAVLSCPQHGALAAALLPFYVDALLAALRAARVSPRQFRLAAATAVRVASPPFPLAADEPLLAETLLEVLRARAADDPDVGVRPLPLPLPPAGQADVGVGVGDPSSGSLPPPPQPPMSEQSVLVLALLDALPCLAPPRRLPEWLDRAAGAAAAVADPALREPVRARLLDLLASGELDAERGLAGLEWWSGRGGRDKLLRLGAGAVAVVADDEAPMMSGALAAGRGVTSRL
ncbi:peroxin 8 [Xylariaceae sp. FL0804]|nr:peroxin 8 [Xylariaceae sp. FL0804]